MMLPFNPEPVRLPKFRMCYRCKSIMTLRTVMVLSIGRIEDWWCRKCHRFAGVKP